MLLYYTGKYDFQYWVDYSKMTVVKEQFSKGGTIHVHRIKN
ncbi:hypothetical protein QFZ87_003819 [Bacillus sp. SLBN-46]|jgi:hypothetical protein|nr:hypothetical protein [Bacillus sp. SLBN-46]